MDTVLLKQVVEPKLVCLGRFIRQKRTLLRLSQEELADRAGLHRTYVSDLERGGRNLTLGAAWSIAHGLGVDLMELMRAFDQATAEPSTPEIHAKIELAVSPEDEETKYTVSFPMTAADRSAYQSR